MPYASWLKNKAILSHNSFVHLQRMDFVHIQIRIDARLSSLTSSVSLNAACVKALFINHVYHRTMLTVCYHFHGWTGSNLELLHETRLYRHHWNRSHLVKHSQPHDVCTQSASRTPSPTAAAHTPNIHIQTHTHTHRGMGMITLVLGNSCQVFFWVHVFSQHLGLCLLRWQNDSIYTV